VRVAWASVRDWRPTQTGKVRHVRSFFRSDPHWKRLVAAGLASIGVMMATRFISNGLIADIILVLAAGSFLLLVRQTYRRGDDRTERDNSTDRRCP
jgi:hypothetical protein